MPVPSQGHCGFPVVDRVCLFVHLRVLPFPLEDCSEFGNCVIILNYQYIMMKTISKHRMERYSLKTACPQTEHSKKNSHIELINYQLLTNDIKPNRNSEQNEATNVHFRFSDVP